MRLAMATALVVLLGCGGKKAPAGGDFKEVEAKVGEVNAKVPASLPAPLTFKAARLDKDRLGALLPDGWVESQTLPGLFQPAGQAVRDGYLTRYAVGSNCDGACEAKDWASVVKSNEFEIPRGDVIKDEALGADGRLLIKDQDGTLVLRLARWKAGASRYFYCKVTLEADARPAADAFEAACRALTPLRW
ncbi:MAG: hypothetical protein IT370_13905 [Deltaproteobacteria bacterium]|nr:hypothetical protein [Deltaproteobacteria bacterium]